MKSVYPFLYTEEQFERAAIIEYCGNLPRIEAEELARKGSEGVIQSPAGTFIPPDWQAK